MATMFGSLDYLSSFFASSFASSSFSSRQFLRRLLSSGSSSSASPPPELALETPQPPTAIAATDIESGPPSPPPAIDGRGDEAADAKRVAKLVQPVALAAAAGSLVLFVNAGTAAVEGHRPKLQAAYLALACLGLFTSLGLSMHAVVRSGDPVGVAALHKRLLLLAIAFVLCAAVVRFSIVIPSAVSLEYVLAFLVLGAMAALFFLRLTGKIAQAT